MDFFNYLIDLGPSVSMVFIIIFLGLVLGAEFSKVLRAGLTVGIGFTGLNLVIKLLIDNLGPAVTAMVDRLGVNLAIIDVGWGVAATISYSSKVGILIIPICIIINIIMLVTNTTQTLNVDIWNYWHFAFTGSLVSLATDSLVWGIIAASINMIIIIIIADLTAQKVEEYNDLSGVSMANGFSAAYVPLAVIFNKVIDQIPKVNEIKANPKVLEQKFGVFGEPITIGTALGMLIAILAGYEVKSILELGIKMGAVLVLIPKMAAMLAEGLLPISKVAQKFIDKYFEHKDKIFIGIDPTAIIGHPTAMSSALMLIPTTIILAVVLPGNKVLPFADLAILPYMLCMVVLVTEADLFRTYIIGSLIMILGLWVSTDLAALHTKLALNADFTMPKGVTMVSSLDEGGNPLIWTILRLIEYKKIGFIILAIISLILALYNRKRILEKTPDNSSKVKSEF